MNRTIESSGAERGRHGVMRIGGASELEAADIRLSAAVAQRPVYKRTIIRGGFTLHRRQDKRLARIKPAKGFQSIKKILMNPSGIETAVFLLGRLQIVDFIDTVVAHIKALSCVEAEGIFDQNSLVSRHDSAGSVSITS